MLTLKEKESRPEKENPQPEKDWGVEPAVGEATPIGLNDAENVVPSIEQALNCENVENGTTPHDETPAEFVDRLVEACHEEYSEGNTFTEDHLRDALVSAIHLIEGTESTSEDFVIVKPVLLDFVDARLRGSVQPRILPLPVEPETQQEGGAA